MRAEITMLDLFACARALNRFALNSLMLRCMNLASQVMKAAIHQFKSSRHDNDEN